MVNLLSGSLGRLSLPLLRWAPDPVVLVEPHEADAYRQAHPLVTIEALPDSGRGFGYLLNRMVERTLAAGERFFVFSDDDVTDLRVRGSTHEKFQPCRGPRAACELGLLVELAAEGRFAQLAVSFAGASWSAKQAWTEPSGAWGVHITDAQAVQLLGGYDEALPCFNDWEMSARLLSSGFRCARTNLLTFVHKMRSHEGGAEQVYRDPAAVTDAAVTVASRYPGAARVVPVEAHGLTEVRFNWRRLTPARATR